MPLDWKPQKLSDHIRIKHGFAFKGESFSDTPTEFVLLTPGNFKIGGGFKGDKLKYYSEPPPVDYILQTNDIVVTMTDLSKAGDTLGYSAKVPTNQRLKFLHNQRLGRVQLTSSDLDADFIYWILRTREYHAFVVGSATGSTVKHTSPSRISEYEFLAPSDKFEQIRIARILSSLEEKMELNQRMNATLEKIAQGIFKRWFVDFQFPSFDGELINGLPKGWKRTTLGSGLELIIDHRGKTPTKLGSEWRDEGIPAVSAKNVKNGRLINLDNVGFVDAELYGRWMKEKLQPFDILLTSEAPLGELAMVVDRTNYCLSQRLFGLRTNSTTNPHYLFHYLLSTEGNANLQKRATGTTVLGIRQSELRKAEILMPAQEIQDEFGDIVEPLRRRIAVNEIESEQLTVLRDSLLPKLMSGQIRVPA